jgi:lipoprotein-anchoring transpeptidase ErfK/SrfK
MYTTGWAYIRNTPDTYGSVLTTIAPGTAVTSYGTAQGQALDSGPTWHRVSDRNSAPKYVYAGLLTTNKPNADPGSNAAGKVIKVSVSQQHLYAYEDGKLVFDTLVITGRPELATPIGTFKVTRKLHPTTFYSPYPKTSPYYYPPTYINYALNFWGEVYLHDATWRPVFGPSVAVNDRSHGCVNMTLNAAAWLYNWAPIGTTVVVYN